MLEQKISKDTGTSQSVKQSDLPDKHMYTWGNLREIHEDRIKNAYFDIRKLKSTQSFFIIGIFHESFKDQMDTVGYLKKLVERQLKVNSNFPQSLASFHNQSNSQREVHRVLWQLIYLPNPAMMEPQPDLSPKWQEPKDSSHPLPPTIYIHRKLGKTERHKHPSILTARLNIL